MRWIYFVFLIVLNAFGRTAWTQERGIDSNLPVTPLPQSQASPDLKVQSQFPYFTIGLGPFPIPVPVFGLGYRYQNGHNGVDASFSASTVVVLTEIKTTLLYQYYFKPSYSSQFYVGAGPTVAGLLGYLQGNNPLIKVVKILVKHRNALLLSPEFVVGKQYKTQSGNLRFIQAEINWPTVCIYNHRVHLFMLPLVVLNYGISF